MSKSTVARLAPAEEMSDERLLELLTISKPHIEPAVRLTPSLAARLLDVNTHNRELSSRTVEAYAKEMAAGRWRETHQGMAIDNEGRLLDGQHRCKAVIVAGVPIMTDIKFGLDPESFAMIDLGRKRTTADALYLDGVQSPPKLLAAVLRCLLAVRTTPRGQLQVPPSAAELMAERKYWPRVDVVIALSAVVRGKVRSFNSGHVAGLVMIDKQATEDSLLAFLHKVESGIGIVQKTDPIAHLRNQFMQPGRMVKRPNECAALLIKVWNYHRAARPMQLLNWRADEAFPKVMG